MTSTKLGPTYHLPPGAPPLKPHPFAGLFPMMATHDPRGFEMLKADIKQNGVREPIILHQGAILDGRNRYAAALELGIGIPTATFPGSEREALDLVASYNIHRRHLKSEQRALIAAKMAEIRLGGNQFTAKPAPIGAPSLPLHEARPAPAPHVASEPDQSLPRAIAEPVEPPPLIEPAKQLISQSDAAEMMNVSRRSVQRAAVVIEKGAPELVEAVTAGKVAASAAADIAQLPLDRQREIVAAADPKITKQVAKEQRSAKREASREKKLEKMRAPTAAPLLTGQKYGVIYIDIPRDWKAWSATTGMEKSPENHYTTAPFHALADLPVRELAAENCALLMWAWQPSLIDQIELMAEWGFASLRPRNPAGRLIRGADGRPIPPAGDGEYRSHMVWGKRTAAGAWHRGTGFWWINCHELLLLGVCGDVPCPLEGMQEMSIIDTIVGEHSAKPDAIRAMIDRYFPGVAKIEMFARVYDDAGNRLIDATKWPDWRFWGAEAVAPDPDKQVSQDEARYRAIGAGGVRHCGSCRNRIGEHACRKVTGAIGAGMTCNLYASVETVTHAAAATGIDCRVCGDGNGLCPQCVVARDHPIRMTLDHSETPSISVATCHCGSFEHRVPFLSDDGGGKPHRDEQDAAIKRHWQEVVRAAASPAREAAE